MTDRERLVILLTGAHNISCDASMTRCASYKEQLELEADHLLANGVTFQKWIPASEPPKEWKDENGDAINYQIYSPGIGIDIGNWIEPAKAWFCLGVPFKVTHWMPLPEPPKEVDK